MIIMEDGKLEYIYLLNYRDQTICEISIKSNNDDSLENILKKYGLDIEEVNVMFTTKKINKIDKLTKIN